MEKNQSTAFDHHIRALDSIAQGALTNSKRPECFIKGVYPTHVSSGYGCFLTDVENRRFIDFICGLGTNLLGYSNIQVNQAISEQMLKGSLFSFASVTEIKTAEKLKEIFPFVTKMRFLKTGTEACLAAIKIARAKTGRYKVLTDGYHGWSDEFVSLTTPALGVPSCPDIKKLTALTDIDRETAAVIIEPVSTDWSKARIDYLKELRDACSQKGAILIFDEIITGFRWPKFSVSNYYDIKPDLICLGKAIANGMPLSVVAGNDSVMNCGEYFVSSTFAGETLSLASAYKTMSLLKDKKFDLDHLWERGQAFLDTFNSYFPEGLTIEGYPTRGVFKGDEMVKALFWQECCLSGILFGPSFFFNFGHIEVMDSVLNTSKDILTRIKTGSVKLYGEMPVSPFAAKVRGNK